MQKAYFTDFEQYAEAIQDVDLDARMLRLHQPTWLMRHIELDSLRMQQAEEGSGFLTEGSVTREGWGLLIQVEGNPMPVNGMQLLSDHVAVLPPGSDFVSLAKAQCIGCRFLFQTSNWEKRSTLVSVASLKLFPSRFLS